MQRKVSRASMMVGDGKEGMERLREKMKAEFYYTLAARKVREMERERAERRLGGKTGVKGGWKVRMPWKIWMRREEEKA